MSAPPDGDGEGGESFGWVDEAAGPVVRHFAVIGGRTRTRQRHSGFDLVAIIQTADVPEVVGRRVFTPGPEHEHILEMCRLPLSVAEVASELDLPVGVVRILLGDLLDNGLIDVRRPARVAQFPHAGVLKEVIDGLSAL